jgi:hypothetical protein
VLAAELPSTRPRRLSPTKCPNQLHINGIMYLILYIFVIVCRWSPTIVQYEAPLL